MKENVPIYTIVNEGTKRRYPVTGNENSTFETVFASQKCWFSKGARITVIDPKGKSQTFVV